MGEYIKNMTTGEEIKIGVMDRCFFSRGQIKEWLDDPAWIGWYAGKEEEGTLGRYYSDPKSFYEVIEGLNHKEFAIKIDLDDPANISHEKFYLWHKGKRGSGYQFQVECQFRDKTELWASIVGERYNEKGEGRTIFACDCCDTWFSLDKVSINKALQDMREEERKYLSPILKAVNL